MEKDFRVKCDCSTHEVHVFSDNYVDDPFIELSIWTYYSGDKSTFWQRIRYCWKMLFTGRIYGDQVLLTKKTCKQLGEHLIEVANSIVEKKG